MIINNLLDFQNQFFKISLTRSKIFNDDFEIMINNLNLKHNLHIDNIFYKNKYRKYFLLFNKYFKTFINLFLLFIQSEYNNLFYIINLIKNIIFYIIIICCVSFYIFI